MKIAFVYPYNRSQLLENVRKGEDPDNALYGFNYFKKEDVFLCEANQTLEKILNFLLNPLNILFLKQIDIDFKLARAILIMPLLNKADVIVSNVDGMSLAICFLKKLGLVKTPLIYAVGLFYINGRMVDDLKNNSNSHFTRFYKWLIGSADHILYHAEIEKQKLQTLGLFNPATCTFLPMGSDDRYFKPEADKIDTNLVVSVGKDRARDYKTLILAAGKLPRLNFIIVCRPSNIPEIKIPPNVSILTDRPYEKIKDLYRKAVMAVIPIKEMHRSSGQMTLTDSIQAQIPVLVSNVVGIKHYNLTNFQNAMLVKPEDPNDLRKAISVLSKDVKLQEKIRTNLKTSAKLYSTRNYANSLKKVILQTVSHSKLYPITQKDLDYLRRLRNNNRQFFLNSEHITRNQHLNWFKAYQKKNTAGIEYMFILKDEGGNRGTGAIYDIDHKKRKAKIGRFIIDESQRGKGFGEILLREIVNVASLKLSLKKLTLEVLAGNKTAIDLYSKHQFKPVKTTISNGRKIIIMSLVQFPHA